MRLGLLGSFELVGSDGRLVEITAAHRRTVLAVLALDLNQVVSFDRLAEAVWADRQPLNARNTLQVYVSGLRKVLAGTMRLVTRDGGYVLAAAESAVDVHRFHGLVAEARATSDDETAARLLCDALALWRGPALSGLGEQLRATAGERLERARQSAVLAHAERLLRLRRGAEAVPELVDVVDAQPLHEPAVRALMLSLHQEGRTAEALGVFHRSRTGLAEELGVDPSGPLRAAYQLVLADSPTASSPTAGSPTAEATPGAPDPAAVPRSPAQLPQANFGFRGRDRDLAWLREHADRPIITVSGPAGMGKTALALHWAHRNAGRFADGQLFVDMRGFDETAPLDPGTALEGFLRALGTPQAVVPDTVEDRSALFRSTLADRRVLVLVDNARTAAQVRPLLPGNPNCQVIVTSRNHLAGLVVQEGAAALRLAALPEAEAVELVSVLVGARRAAAEPAAIRQLVRLCDNLPLALRIAGARLSTDQDGTVAALVDELRDEHTRLAALTTDDSDISVAAALELSCLALPEPAADLFGALGLYPGRAIDAWAAAALHDSPYDTTRRHLDLLASAHLVDKQRDGHYRQHDLVRLFGRTVAARRIPAAQRDAAVLRLLDYYLAITRLTQRLANRMAPIGERHTGAATAELPMLSTPAEALAWFEGEEAGLRATIEYAAEHGHPDRAWQLADLAGPLYYDRGNYLTWLSVVHTALAAARAAGSRFGEMRMLCRRGIVLGQLGRYAEAIESLDAGLAAAVELDDRQHQVIMLDQLAEYSRLAGRTDEAQRYVDRLVTAIDVIDDALRRGALLSNLAGHYLAMNQFDAALAQADRAQELLAGLPANSTQAHALQTRGRILGQTGAVTEALDCFLRGARIAGDVGSDRTQAACLRAAGDLLRDNGRTDEAVPHWQAALALYTRLGRAEADELHAELAGVTTA